MNRPRLAAAALSLVLPLAALAQITVTPAAPQMLDPVRVGIPRSGPGLYDSRSVRVTLADGKFTVFVKSGPMFDPAPPPSTLDVLLGQLPMGTYAVEAVLDDPVPSSLGSTSFTVGPRTSTLPTHSDLWWNPDESGWGINLIEHPSGRIFATLFMYLPNGGPVGPARWFPVPGGTWSGSSVFTGPIYLTSGPQVGATFDPSRVTRTPEGTVTITFLSKDTAQLVLVSGSRTITKSLRRQPF